MPAEFFAADEIVEINPISLTIRVHAAHTQCQSQFDGANLLADRQ